MRRPKRYWLTLLWVLPAALVSWVVVLWCWLWWGTRLHWCEGLWCEFKPTSWPMRTWYRRWGGTTFVWGGILAPGRAGELGVIDTQTEIHEHIHLEQAEAAQLASFIYGLSVLLMWRTTEAAIYGLVIWVGGAAFIYCCTMLQAWFRGEEPYRGNHLEEAAYGLTRLRRKEKIGE